MNGRSYDPNFLFTYPNAKIGVMGSEQLAGVMNIIQRASANAAGIPFDEDNAKVIQQMLILQRYVLNITSFLLVLMWKPLKPWDLNQKPRF